MSIWLIEVLRISRNKAVLVDVLRKRISEIRLRPEANGCMHASNLASQDSADSNEPPVINVYCFDLRMNAATHRQKSSERIMLIRLLRAAEEQFTSYSLPCSRRVNGRARMQNLCGDRTCLNTKHWKWEHNG